MEVAYNRAKFRIARGETPLHTADLRMLLIVGPALPAGWNNPDLSTVADVDAVTDIVVHTERIALTALTVTQDDVNNRANCDAGNPVFAAAAGVVAQAAVIYDNAGAGSDAGRHLICATNTGFPTPLDGGLTINIADWARLI